jgi:nucleoside-diphosphate-sugar epimerase
LFGELDSETRLVARLAQRLEAGQKIGVAPGAFRDICDVVDIVAGYVALAQDCRRGSIFDIFNLSRGTATELKDIALMVAAQIGADPRPIADGLSRMIQPGTAAQKNVQTRLKA